MSNGYPRLCAISACAHACDIHTPVNQQDTRKILGRAAWARARCWWPCHIRRGASSWSTGTAASCRSTRSAQTAGPPRDISIPRARKPRPPSAHHLRHGPPARCRMRHHGMVVRPACPPSASKLSAPRIFRTACECGRAEASTRRTSVRAISSRTLALEHGVGQAHPCIGCIG